jgi:photosystem II stability/assembly factor-like uncharacterized protein
MNTKFYSFSVLLISGVLLFSQSLLHSQSISWSEQTSGVTTQLTSISAVDDNNAWICGYSGVVLRTTNGGANWINVSGSPIPNTLNMHTIYGIDANTALVGGSGTSSFLFRTTNGGANWTQVFTESGGFINSVQMGNIFAGFMMGDPVGGRWSLWGTTDAGLTWDSSSFYLPQNGAEAGWNNAFYFDLNFGVAFGTNNTRHYKTFNLVNWMPQTTTGQANSYAVWYNSITKGMTGGTGLLFTNNGGLTWTPTPTALPGTANLSGINGTGSFWAVTRQATVIYTTVDDGTTWLTNYTAPAGNYRHISKDRTSGGVYYAVRTNGGISKGLYVTGITPVSNEVPSQFNLEQNYPNPFNPSTTIKFNLPMEGAVKLAVFDGLGREVKSLVNENLRAGYYSVNFDASGLTSGAYFYKLVTSGYTQTKKMVLVK